MPELDDRTRALLDRIEAATDGRRLLKLSYAYEAGNATDRTVRPLGLWFWGKVWTLVAWCELRDDFRMFRVNRIGEMTEGERFHDERGKTLSAFYALREHRGAL